ncbi:hypothetical protein KSP39_PZI015001 [Platanthera zijinensis]|uniref:Succinate dehydrogenase subunit 4, mitochondrial n=1 Tax=Platanthera zijinensis TaxID=2320716 RepID=A0AAP0BAW5_9ASPA
MASRLFSSRSKTLTLTFNRFCNPYHSLIDASASSKCLSAIHSPGSTPPAPTDRVGSSYSSLFGPSKIFPCRPHQVLCGNQKNAAALCSFAAAQSSRGVKHQAEIAQSTAAEKNGNKTGGEVSDKHSLEPNLLDVKNVISFSPLEGSVISKRVSALTKESSKIKMFELSQKITFALIPVLLLVSKNSLTTSLLIFSVYWQIYGFFKEIFLDYVHHELTRKWVLIYFQLLLLILGKETVLLLNLV